MILNKIRLGNEYISAEVAVFGGKILSMYNRESKSEWLFQSTAQEIHPAVDGTFTKEVAFGCDEMFPTILPEISRLPDDTPVDLPDHGELWSRDWEVRSQGSDFLEMRCRSGILPVLFERTILLSGRSLICRYRYPIIQMMIFPHFGHPILCFPSVPKPRLFCPGSAVPSLRRGAAEVWEPIRIKLSGAVKDGLKGLDICSFRTP